VTTEHSTSSVLARVQSAASRRALVELYGSSVYAPDHAQDVDILVSWDDPVRLASRLGLELLPTTPPRLHGSIDGVSVDVIVVNGDGEHARRMRAGPRDAELIRQHLEAHDRNAVFQAAWPHVRTFVRKRGLGHNGLGWFGSIGWAILLAAPLGSDPDMRTAPPGQSLNAWFRWLARLELGARVSLTGLRTSGRGEPFHLAAPASPPREVARLTRISATVLFDELEAASHAVGDAVSDLYAVGRIPDLAHEPPAGKTLVITFDGERDRGRYEGSARGLLRELEGIGTARSWGRFDTTEDGEWQHRISVPSHRARDARLIVEGWLAAQMIDASVTGFA